MHVVCLKPVRYDTDFQKELIDGFRVHERKMKRKPITTKSNARARSPNSFKQGGKKGQDHINSPDRVGNLSPRQHSHNKPELTDADRTIPPSIFDRRRGPGIILRRSRVTVLARPGTGFSASARHTCCSENTKQRFRFLG